MKLMFIIVLRVVAVLLAGAAAYSTVGAVWFRLEGADDLHFIEETDFVIGLAFALAVFLFFVPGYLGSPKACVVILIVSAMTWISVSGSLFYLHHEQHRIRSSH
jgi:hypothetical protein